MGPFMLFVFVSTVFSAWVSQCLYLCEPTWNTHPALPLPGSGNLLDFKNWHTSSRLEDGKYEQ